MDRSLCRLGTADKQECASKAAVRRGLPGQSTAALNSDKNGSVPCRLFQQLFTDTGVSARSGEHAVVIGGSMAGLLTARVLSDHFDRVSIFQADTPPEQAVPRAGVPPGNHVYGLLAGAKIT